LNMICNFLIYPVKYILLICLILIAENVFSQEGFNNVIMEHRLIKSREASRNMNYDDVNGSPYHTPDFVQSRVVFPKGDTVPVNLRFDLFSNEMEFKNKDWILWMDKNNVNNILYGDEKLILTALPRSKGLFYLFVLEEGDYSLLVKRSVAFHKAVPTGAYKDAVPMRFLPEANEYYIKKGSCTPNMIGQKKDLDDLISGNSKANEFVKKEKIKVSRENDLVKLVKFLNETP
jgi:hypothetical protein